MRILYFYRISVPTARADAIQVLNTCCGLSRAGCHVTLYVEAQRAPSITACLSYYGIADPIGDGAGSLDIVRIGQHWSWPLLSWKTQRILKQASTDRACLFVREVRPYVPGLSTRAKASGMKVIFEAHNVSASLVNEKHEKAAGSTSGALNPHRSNLKQRLETKAAVRAALEASILGNTDGLICTQRNTLEKLRLRLRPGTPTTVLGNATQLPLQRAPDGKQDIDILYCGSLKPWKGVDILVTALRDLPSRNLTLVGPSTISDVERLRNLALGAATADRLTILPTVRPDQVWSLYARAKVGVIPLPGSGFVEAREFTSPLKLFEMMAAGLPMVASRLPSIQEYVADGREALLVEPDDSRSLAKGLDRLLDDKTLRHDLAAAARRRAAEFTWDARGAKIAAFIDRLFR